MVHKTLLAAPLALALVAAPALAQPNSGLVVVDISNVANNIAQDLDVNVSNIPVSVQAPIGVAANVCADVTAAVLAEQARGGGAKCTASSTSRALNQVVQRQLTQQ